MNQNVFLFMACLVLQYTTAFADGEFPAKTSIRDLPTFRKNLGVGIVKEESLDLNGDGKTDHVVYSTGGEEMYLSLLLASTDGFTVWHFPAAESYQVERAGSRYQVVLAFDTYPVFGSLWGSDKYRWFDYYEITQDLVVLANAKHITFFENQQKLYKARLIELKERQRQLEKTKNKDDVLLLEDGRVNALIERYAEWIQKAGVIINAK